MDSNHQDHSAIIQEQKEKISRVEESSKSPRNIPLPETQAQQQGTFWFATSTPQTRRTVGLDTTIWGIEDSLMDTPVPTPESSQFKQKEEIKLPDERKGIMLDTRKVNLHFDGSEVEIFIKHVEKVASMHGAGGQDVALQLPFMTKDRKISKAIENMEGNETSDWELLKKDLICKWGCVTPLRRDDGNSIPNLISKYTEKGGIQTKEDYGTFISDLEEILAYLKKMGYKNVNADSGNRLWNTILTEMQWDVVKELVHKKLRLTKDGKGLIPKLDKLKKYVEASLSILALGSAEARKDAKPKIVEIESTGKLTQLQEEINKLRTELNMTGLGSSPMGTGTYQRPQIQCYYCKEAAHTVIFFPHLTADLDKKLLFKQGPNYYYPNQEPIPSDATPSMQMPTTSLISTNRWEMWSPSEMHYGEDDEDNDVGFGLRRSQRLGNKGKEKEKAEDTTSKSRSSSSRMWQRREGLVILERGLKEIPMMKVAMKAGIWRKPRTQGKNLKITLKNNYWGGGLMKKILKQSFTLTLEELLLIAPKFIQELQNFSTEECHQSPGKSLMYACPLGFVNLNINRMNVRELDHNSRAELNIMPEEVALRLKLPTREIKMNITGIGCFSSPVVGLAEGISFNIDNNNMKAENFFIFWGKVYTVLGQPFLADHKVHLELSQSRGEILSYELWDGGRLCIICSPKVPGWETAPQCWLIEKYSHSIQLGEYMDHEE
ncbi:hypothetical protein VP01_1120g4 [Puccinia sorghi]|uniref:Uncharacterized protein n=1 Tax=Puccinia sorghi TaxID=27349 RepID=A0A0L6VSE1_9BASI|nr:hypothetical protein VP01_1120g4 [Puccinia sorghi]